MTSSSIRRQPSVLTHLLGLVALVVLGSAILVWVVGEVQRGRPVEERLRPWKAAVATIDQVAPSELRSRGFEVRPSPPPRARPLHPRMARALGRSSKEVVLAGGTVWVQARGAGWVALEHDARWVSASRSRWTLWLVIAAIALLGAAWVARRLVVPLASLERAVPLLVSGEPFRLPPAAPREIASLAQALVTAQQAAGAASRERTVMLAGISHDLRTPLARMRFALELMEALPANVDLASGMDRDIGEIDAIVGQFIDYARHGQDEAATQTDLAELVRDVLATEDPDGVWTAELPANAFLAGRPLALRRAVGNLVRNAKQHGQAPWGATLARRGNVWQLDVSSAGPCLSSSEKASLLQPFVRGPQSMGSGLGLAIAARVAASHQGTLELLDAAPSGVVARLVLASADGAPSLKGRVVAG